MTRQAQDIVLVGGGGHCRSCIDVIEAEDKFRIAGIVDRPSETEPVLGYPILGSDDDLPELVRRHQRFLVAVGQIKDPGLRVRLYRLLKEQGAILPSVVSPLARVSPHASVGEGTIVMHFALVNAGAQIGHNCIINSKALVEHDAVIGDHCHVATGAIVNGGVTVGARTFIGSNAVTREAISIGRGQVVGAGQAVMRPVGSRDEPEGD